MSNLQSLISATRPLADVLVDKLRRNRSPLSKLRALRRDDDDGSSQPQLPLDDDDDDDRGEGGDDTSESMVSIRPDEAAAAVLLGRALDQHREALASMLDGGAVVIEIPDTGLVAPTIAVFRHGVFGNSWSLLAGDGLQATDAKPTKSRTAILFTGTGGKAKYNDEVSWALQMRCPVIGVAADVEDNLPGDLLRIADHRLALPALDVEAVASVIEAVTGRRPAALDPKVAHRLTVRDLMLTVRSDFGAQRAMERVNRLVGRMPPAADRGPLLSELHGLGPAQTWGLNLVDDLREYRAGRLPFSEIDKGILLAGPPGTGKTTWARALARQAGVHFIATSYSDWQSHQDGHLGTVTKSIRKTFKEAAKNAPAIIFIDEIDTLPARGSGNKHDDWWTAILNTLLEQLDGFEKRDGVVVIAACNNPANLDPALIRSGRLDRQIRIELPDVPALIGIMRFHLGADLADLDLRAAAVAAYGATGADVERWVRGVRRRARIRKSPMIASDLLAEIRDGRPDLPGPVRRRVGYHEGGHAIIALALHLGELQSLSINADGGNAHLRYGETRAQSRADIEEQLAFLLGGRAAEHLVFGTVTAGAGGSDDSDLAMATKLAIKLETTFGLGDQGPLWLGDRGESSNVLLLPEIRIAVRKTLDTAQARAVRILEDRRQSLDRLAEALIKNNYLDRDEIRALVDPGLLPMPEAISIAAIAMPDDAPGITAGHPVL